MSKLEIWQQHITNWKESGLSQAAFCHQQNIKQHNLQYWKKRLNTSCNKPAQFTPVVVTRSTPTRLLLGSQVAIEIASDNLPDLLLALRDRGLLHAATE